MEIKVQYTNNQTKPKSLKGSFESNVNLIQGKINILKGVFVFNGDIEFIIKKLPLIIGHEFLHAYESWKCLLNGGKTLFDVAHQGHILKNNQILKMSKNDIEQALADVFYYCNNVERRAYLAQLNQELLLYKNDIKDVESTIQVIQKTPLYNNLITLGKNLYTIREGINQYPTYKTIIVNYFKELTGENKSAEYVLKYLEKLWNKTWQHFRLRTTRLVKMLFDSNNVAPQWIEEFDKPIIKLNN